MLSDYTKLGGEGLTEARGVAGFKSGMPGLGHVMSDDEIWDVLAYIRSDLPLGNWTTQNEKILG